MQMGMMLRRGLALAAAGACLVIAPMAMAQDDAGHGQDRMGPLG